MSLLDSAKYQIKVITNAIKTTINATVNSTTVSYGFIGVTTAILGYYTFFENNIEIPLEPENQNTNPPENQNTNPPENQNANPPENQNANPPENQNTNQQPLFGGNKNKKKRTKRRF